MSDFLTEQNVLALIALVTAVGTIITVIATTRAASSTSWSQLVGALSDRVETLEGEIDDLKTTVENARTELATSARLLSEQEHELEQHRFHIAAQQETIESQGVRITALEHELRRHGVNPNDIGEAPT